MRLPSEHQEQEHQLKINLQEIAIDEPPSLPRGLHEYTMMPYGVSLKQAAQALREVPATVALYKPPLCI
jgi:hypothetical protein